MGRRRHDVTKTEKLFGLCFDTLNALQCLQQQCSSYCSNIMKTKMDLNSLSYANSGKNELVSARGQRR